MMMMMMMVMMMVRIAETLLVWGMCRGSCWRGRHGKKAEQNKTFRGKTDDERKDKKTKKTNKQDETLKGDEKKNKYVKHSKKEFNWIALVRIVDGEKTRRRLGGGLCNLRRKTVPPDTNTVEKKPKEKKRYTKRNWRRRKWGGGWRWRWMKERER